VFEALSQYGDRILARYQTSGLPAFMRWWWGELRPLVPDALMRAFEVPGERLLITSHDGQWLLWRAGSDEVALLDRLDMDADPAQSRDRVQASLDRFEDALTGIVHCLPHADLLSKRLRLPVAAESNLQQAVGFELDRQTPFRREDVYYDVHVVRREPPFIDADLYLVPRERVDGPVQQLGRLGLTLQGVDIDGERAGDAPPAPLQVNLLPREQRARRSNRRVRINTLLGAAAVVLVALLMAQSLYLRGQTLTELTAQRDALRSEALEVARLQQRLDDAIDGANFLAEQQAVTADPLDVIAEVTQRLPTDTWIQRLQINGTELEVLGLSDRSQTLVERLDGSPLFEGTSFKGTIASDRRLDKERFTATATIDPAAAYVADAVEQAPAGEDDGSSDPAQDDDDAAAS
jgi:general secretion pathway protein L